MCFFGGLFFVRMSSRYALVYRQRLRLWNYCSLGVLVYAFLFQRLCLWGWFCSVVHLLRFVHRQSLRLWNYCSLEVERYASLIGKGFVFGTVAHWGRSLRFPFSTVSPFWFYLISLFFWESLKIAIFRDALLYINL